MLEGLLDGEYQPRPKQVVPLTSLQMVTQLTFLLTYMLVSDGPPLVEFSELEAVFIMCLTWSVGASLVADSRKPVGAIPI